MADSETMARFRSSLQAGSWEGVWKDGLQPGQAFDGARTSPVTSSKLQSGELDVRGKTCLVPGCGRGYDVVDFVKAGAASAVGLEIAPTAVVRAAEYRDGCGLDASLASRAKFEEADFFQYTPAGGPVDVGYDYTFLCALPPAQRQAWAEAWAKLVKPGGQLVTLIFPVDPEKPRDSGPPFPVTPELYADLLEPAGFKRTHLEKVPDELSHEGRAGKEFFGRWQRE